MAQARRDWIVGETILLSVSITEPGTSVPFDPTTVELASLKCGDVVVSISTPAFTKVAAGSYRYTLDTENYAAGAYTWRVRAVDDDLGVAMMEESFVLRAAD